MHYNGNNNKRMDREEKVLEIVRSSKVGNISCEEAAIKICLLFSVVGQSEQLKAFAEMVAKDDFAYLKDAETLLKDFESL